MPLVDTTCPSCKGPMRTHRLESKQGPYVDIDSCYSCHAIWFDHRENLLLSARAILELFAYIHEHSDAVRYPLAASLSCPRCNATLARSFDVVSTGRYITYRCPYQHGRMATFSSFLTEKGFVRQMTRVEVDELARRVKSIYCNGCGAPVDIRKDSACPYCGCAFSLLDPQSVEKAMAKYNAQLPSMDARKSAEKLADGLISMERSREIARRENEKNKRGYESSIEVSDIIDIVEEGIKLVRSTARYLWGR